MSESTAEVTREHLLSLYMHFIEDTARFSERRQTINNIYISVNAIILSATALLVKDAGFSPLWRALVVMVILGVGIFICLQWIRMIKKYKLLIDFRIRHLKILEDRAEIKDLYQMYNQENELYPVDEYGNEIKGEGLNFSDLEVWLPITFIIAYSLFLVGFLAFVIFFPEQLGIAP